MQRNRKKTTTSRSCIEINGGERETLHRYLVRSTITNAPSGLFKRHTRNKSTRAPTETTSSFLLQNLPKKAQKIEEKEENPMMVFPMRRKFLRANSPNSAFAKQKSVEKREGEREKDGKSSAMVRARTAMRSRFFFYSTTSSFTFRLLRMVITSLYNREDSVHKYATCQYDWISPVHPSRVRSYAPTPPVPPVISPIALKKLPSPPVIRIDGCR
jgi:hypothetical protein